MAGTAGFEPTISESKSGVLPLHYIPIWMPPSDCIQLKPVKNGLLKVNGVGNGARTHDARNHNPVLCQLSYTHHILFNLVRQEGLEPPAYCLEGSCSIHLSYWRISSSKSAGAGDGNRTHVPSLEGWCTSRCATPASLVILPFPGRNVNS